MTDPLHQPAADLAEIARLGDELLGHSLRQLWGRIPGGPATVSLSPIASPGDWARRIDILERQHYATCLHTEHRNCRIAEHIADEDTDWEDPKQTLRWWTERWREKLGKSTDLRPTHRREADWLRDNLRTLHAAYPAEWADFCRDIATARRRLEDILHDGEREDRTRTPCIDCGALLVRQWADTVVNDRWVCSRKACARSYDKAGYARAQYHHLASEGAERYVPLAAACVATGRPQRTVRQWIADGRVATHRTLIGQRLVWWPDVRDCHETQPLKPRSAKESA